MSTLLTPFSPKFQWVGHSPVPGFRSCRTGVGPGNKTGFLLRPFLLFPFPTTRTGRQGHLSSGVVLGLDVGRTVVGACELLWFSFRLSPVVLSAL